MKYVEFRRQYPYRSFYLSFLAHFDWYFALCLCCRFLKRSTYLCVPLWDTHDCLFLEAEEMEHLTHCQL